MLEFPCHIKTIYIDIRICIINLFENVLKTRKRLLQIHKITSNTCTTDRTNRNL